MNIMKDGESLVRFQTVDEKNGGSQLAKLIIERCTHLHLFVGEAMNPAHQAAGLPFDLSVRMRFGGQDR